MVLFPCRSPKRLRSADQRSQKQLKMDIEIMHDNLFFIKQMPEGLALDKWYFVQVDKENSDPVFMR